MTGFENHAGITVSGTKLQLVEVVYKDNRFILENVDEAYFSEPLNFEKDKETKISALMQGALNEILIKKPLKSSAVSFTLPFELFYVMQVPYDNTLLHQDLIEEFKWELSVLYPFVSAADLVIQYIEVERNNFINENTALVFAIPRKYLQILHGFCRDNNLNLRFVDNAHLASERALSLNNSLQGKGLVLSVFFAHRHLSVIYSYAGKPLYVNSIPLTDAGELTTHLLTETSPRESFNINRNLIETAYIAGEDISDTITGTLKNLLEIEFNNFNPFEKIKPNPSLLDNKHFTEKNNSFSPAAGIAYRLA